MCLAIFLSHGAQPIIIASNVPLELNVLLHGVCPVNPKPRNAISADTKFNPFVELRFMLEKLFHVHGLIRIKFKVVEKI